MIDIPGYGAFAKIEPINKGQSSDQKYCVETAEGRRMLLRVTDIKEFGRKKAEYGMMERVYALGVLTPKPYSFGLCEDGRKVYSLSGWLEGIDVESALPRMNETEQYGVGMKAGAVLRNRPQTFWHGDFSAGNQMIMPDGEIAVIDYNYWNLDYGDPWWEFVVIPWGEEPPAQYFTGMINGYFDNDPPTAFFEALAYYYACDALSALCYTFLGCEPYPPEDGRRHMENVLRWFDNMNNPVPSWYGDMR